RAGKLPAILYGHKREPVGLTLDRHDVEMQLAHGAHLINLEMEGRKQPCLIKDVQYDHLGSTPIHVDLTRVELDERVKVRVPIEVRGHAKGVAEGGVLFLDVAEVEILSRCLDDAGGEMNLTGEMVVNTSGDFVLDASRDCLPCSSGDRAGGLRSPRGGKTRPTLRVRHVAAMSIGGDFVLIEGASIYFGSSEPLVVEGSFVNQSTCPDFFNWTAGGISFDMANSRSFLQGPGGQSFEVAGHDFGPSLAGFASNFAVGEVGDASKPGISSIIDRISADGGPLSSDDLVDRCLDFAGPLTVGADTRSALLKYARSGGELGFGSEAERQKSASRIVRMMQLVVSTKEYQFA
ncbi:MAG: 50S ribosomal protein L25, partial [Chloroflexi bacterium]|nr:50S ribosomal protein L25 [Chloroflexota bacterium]